MIHRALLGVAIVAAACSVELGSTPATHPDGSGGRPTPAGVPTSWQGLDLEGSLLLATGQTGLQRLDLETGLLTSLFSPPDQRSAWVNAASISPDGSRIVMAYAPPPPPGEVQFGYTDLYLMPSDGSSEPTAWLTKADQRESYFSPLWSPDGRYIYYGHLLPVTGVLGVNFTYVIERRLVEDGEVEVVVRDAYWPRLSPDGKRLAYAAVDLTDFSTWLMVADADGSNAIQLTSQADFPAIDAPLFAPDGQAIWFSAVVPTGGPRVGILDGLLGTRVASAHSVPSDWYRVPARGGPAERMTETYGLNLYGAFVPRTGQLLFTNGASVYLLGPAPHRLTLLGDFGPAYTVDWVPSR